MSYAENVTFHMQDLSAHEMGVIEDMEDITADIVAIRINRVEVRI